MLNVRVVGLILPKLKKNIYIMELHLWDGETVEEKGLHIWIVS